MEQSTKLVPGKETDEEKIINYTESLLFAVREGNEYKAVSAAKNQIDTGLPGFLDDLLTEWKFYLVRTLTLMTDVMLHNGRMGRYLDQFATERMKKIAEAVNVEECHGLLISFAKEGCRLTADVSRHYSVQVQKIMEEVAMDLTLPLTLQYFAGELNVNSSYLSNLFRQQTGVTITDYVTDKRMSHAATLLGYTQRPIKTIAKQVGIPDVQYFSRLFKRRMGMTPTQYREKEMAPAGE